MGRRIVSLIACALALFFTLTSGAEPEELPGSGAPFPAWEEEVTPTGELYVQGRRVHGSTFRTALPVDEVIARHRAEWEAAPVDLIEQALPDGRLLSILDIPGGRHLVVVARSVGGGTDVLRGWSPLGVAPRRRRPLALPADWAVVASVEDRLGSAVVHTETLLARLSPAQAEEALRLFLLGQGWSEEGALQFARAGERLEVAFQGKDDGAAVQVRHHGRSER